MAGPYLFEERATGKTLVGESGIQHGTSLIAVLSLKTKPGSGLRYLGLDRDLELLFLGPTVLSVSFDRLAQCNERSRIGCDRDRITVDSLDPCACWQLKIG